MYNISHVTLASYERHVLFHYDIIFADPKVLYIHYFHFPLIAYMNNWNYKISLFSKKVCKKDLFKHDNNFHKKDYRLLIDLI